MTFTLTINPLEIFRFIFIVGWLIIATFITVMQNFTVMEKDDVVVVTLVWIFCGGSTLVLYFGR